MGQPRPYEGRWQAYLAGAVHAWRLAPRPLTGLRKGCTAGDDTLNAFELKKVMDGLDFTSADVAIVTGVTRRTVQLWMAGAPIPLSAGILLEGILEGLLPMEWVEDKILDTLRVT